MVVSVRVGAVQTIWVIGWMGSELLTLLYIAVVFSILVCLIWVSLCCGPYMGVAIGCLFAIA